MNYCYFDCYGEGGDSTGSRVPGGDGGSRRHTHLHPPPLPFLIVEALMTANDWIESTKETSVLSNTTK